MSSEHPSLSSVPASKSSWASFWCLSWLFITFSQFFLRLAWKTQKDGTYIRVTTNPHISKQRHYIFVQNSLSLVSLTVDCGCSLAYESSRCLPSQNYQAVWVLNTCHSSFRCQVHTHRCSRCHSAGVLYHICTTADETMNKCYQCNFLIVADWKYNLHKTF